MRCLKCILMCVMASAGLSAAGVAQSGVVDNVLLEWRSMLSVCGQPAFGEVYTMRDLDAAVHVTMFEAINAIERKYKPYAGPIPAPAGSSPVAAAAQAAYEVLTATCGERGGAFERALTQSLAGITDERARTQGRAVGRAAGRAVLDARANSGANGPIGYWPATTPGRYVATSQFRGREWATMTPWIMRRHDELRPPPPPPVDGEVFRRDVAEVKRLGAARGSERTVLQTNVAQFWAPRDVRVVARQLVGLPGRSLVDDARFLALVEMAWADSFIAMMDGKHAYMFWRPITAIQASAAPGSSDAHWEPLISTPPHPEYPCGHCLSAAAVGAVIEGEFGAAMPVLVVEDGDRMLRRYANIMQYVDEVTISRMWAGVHYRFSNEAGKAVGLAIGRAAHQRHFTR